MLSSPPTEETNLVPLELLKRYVDIGFILVPLFQNSVHLNIDGLVTDAEWESLPDSVQIEGRYKGDLSGKRPRKNLLALYHLSDRFWTHGRLEKEHYRFFGVATLLGKSPKKDPIDGSDLYVNGLDPDSEDARNILFNEILVKQDLAAKTFVAKTYKSWHAYWLSHKQNPPLANKHCKPGSEAELKTNLSSMTLTLPITRHRKHRDFRYRWFSSANQLLISDTLYGDCISTMHSKGYLVEIPTFESNGKEGNNRTRKKISPENIPKEDSRRELTQDQIDDAIIVLATRSGGSYSEGSGSRNTCTLHYGAYFFKNNIKLESTRAFCTDLCAYTTDNELDSRLRTIEGTYDRGYDGESIKGKSGLLELFKKFNGNDSNLAERILKEFSLALGINEKKEAGTAAASTNESSSDGDSDENSGGDSEESEESTTGDNSENDNNTKKKSKKKNRIDLAGKIVKLARNNIPLFFKNEFLEPCALIKLTDGHYEVIELGTPERPNANFASYLSKIFRTENSKYTTVSYESTIKATRTLISDIQFGENIPQIELHLRSAWVKGKENELLHYDLTNQSCQRIEISKKTCTWRIVESEEIARAYGTKGKEESAMQPPISSATTATTTTTIAAVNINNNANNRPPLFRRYSQIPQVIPSKTYDPNILDIFFERFTNITGKYSKDSDRIISENSFLENVEMNGYKKKLLAKVGFITMYIPDIPRCIQTIVGPEGAAKTSYGKYEKSAVDPSATMMETFIPNAENIKLHFSHNYVTFYNNIRGIPDWVSDLFCLCVSGGDSSQRARYYDSKEFNSKFKHNLILSTIHQVLKESDAVDREFRISLARLDKTKTKSEIEMDAQFEKIKPELLGYTFDILAKAMSLKKPLETYASARMPDFEQWGEAIAQAMGYKECEFRDAYSDLIKIQKQKALSYDPLSEKLRILFNDGSAIKKEQSFKIFTPAVLLETLNGLGNSGTKTNSDNNYSKDKEWPKNGQQLMRRLESVKVPLEESEGVKIVMGQNKFNAGNAIYDSIRTKGASFIMIVDARNREYIDILKGKKTQTLPNKGSPISIRKDSSALKNITLGTSKKDSSVNNISSNNQKDSSTRDFSTKELRGPIFIRSDNIGPKTKDCLNTYPKNVENAGEAGEPVLRLFGVFKQNNTAEKSLTFSPHKNNNSICSMLTTTVTNNDDVLNTKKCQNMPHQVHQVHQKQSTITITDSKQLQSNILQVPFKPLALPDFLNYDIIASFDSEWDPTTKELYCYCFVDTDGKEVKLHISDYQHTDNPKYNFLKAIIHTYKDNYTNLPGVRRCLVLGYSIFSDYNFESDLGIMKRNCSDYLDLHGEWETLQREIEFVDVYRIFANEAIAGSLKGAGVDYRTNSLDNVSKANIGRGKLNDINGLEALVLSPDKQKDYCVEDCRLVLENCAKADSKTGSDWTIFRMLHSISEALGLDFVSTCNTQYPSDWWAHKLKSVGYYVESSLVDQTPFRDIGGGAVMGPNIGMYYDVMNLDISSMYPSITDVNNISSETICCSHEFCKNQRRLPLKLMEIIREPFALDNLECQSRPDCYWICDSSNNQEDGGRGLLSKIQEELRDKKRYYKAQKDKYMEKGIKILANAGVGVFGLKGGPFPYKDFRVNEIITGFGRYYHGVLQDLCGSEKYDMPALYGDTDSIFLENGALPENKQKLDEFIEEAQVKLNGLEISKENSWKLIVFVENKKQYFGITYNNEIDITGMHGLKRDQPKYFNSVTNRVIQSVLELFRDCRNASEDILENKRKSVITLVKEIFDTLQSKIENGSDNIEFITNELKYSFVANKNLNEYDREGYQMTVYREKLEEFYTKYPDSDLDPDMYLTSGKVYEYYKIMPVEYRDEEGKIWKQKFSICPTKYMLNAKQYKKELFTNISLILRAIGIEKAQLEDLKNNLVNSA